MTEDELEQKLDLMKREIDALQIASAGPAKPWYKTTSTILSIVALIFSFSTSYLSHRRTTYQDMQSARQELRGLLQRLAALPKENVDLRRKYMDDPVSMNFVGGFINQENSLLARHAAELAKKLPVDLVSGTEHYAIALALQNSYDLAAAEEFLKYSIEAATDFNTEIAALRSTANLQFIQGRPESGRVGYQKALSIFSKYPGYDPFTKASTHMLTELNWASSEAHSGLPDLAIQHVENAKALVNGLPRSPGADELRAQVLQTEMQLAGGLPTNPVAGSQLDVAALSGTN